MQKNILGGITTLLIFQLVGEVIIRALDLPIPGPVMGMVLLFTVLMVRGSTPEMVHASATTLLRHLSLLFVPAGVGIMVHFRLIRHEWAVIVLTLIISLILTLVATALAMQLLLKWVKHRMGEGELSWKTE